MKFLQEQGIESNPIQRRINQLVKVQQVREGVFGKAQVFQDKMKRIFDGKAKPSDFQQDDWVLRWEATYKGKCKNGKFDHLWKGPYQVEKNQGNNMYVLQEENGDFLT